MKNILLHNARVVLERGIKCGGVHVRDGRIAQVFGEESRPVGAGDSIDLDGAYLMPGMLDIHIHGSAGVDVLEADHYELAKLSEFLIREGVTGYFATLVPADERTYRSAIAAIDSYIERRDETVRSVARLIGIHFEGPFVSHHRCGALRREYFRTYDGDPRSIDLFTESLSSAACPRLMTLAPEIEGVLRLARKLRLRGARVFIGHSQADLDTLHRAVEAGARHITHFPNALDGLHHRNPGAVGWGLVREDVTVDCIADFHHVHPLMLRLIYQAKGADGMALISDAIPPAGLGDGEFSFWGEKIAVRDGRTSLAGALEETLAGSVITMRQALKNIIGLGVPVEEAVRMATLVPARVAGIDGWCGSIKNEKRADLVALDDDFEVRLAMIDGVIAFDAR
ncbi:MAG: N-acetylglucosamine-6-phosphate deacetylase [Blastocatellia bacterium]|nr:N-acetylglucosamine-6-phosphate deacetylase [Blastocatellia bacterium]